MKIKVAHFTGSFHQGGTERQAVQLMNLLSDDDSIEVIPMTLEKTGVLLDELAPTLKVDLKEFRLNSFYDTNFLKQLHSAAYLLGKFKVDIVHTHDFYTNIFGGLASILARTPKRISSKRETSGLRSHRQAQIEDILFRRSHSVVANSNAVANYLSQRGIPSEKICVIYNGLDLERLRPNLDQRDVIVREFNLPTGENIRFITLVANLRHQVKNHKMLLRAASIITKNFEDVHFILAGEGQLLQSLKEHAVELGIQQKTHFLGKCDNVPNLLRISYAGVLTSFAEGFSNSIIEYMAAGLPVVATDVGGASEAIHEGETGFLVRSDSHEHLAARLEELLKSPQLARRFGKNGKDLVTKNFSLESQFRQTIELYKRVME